jgi:alpha-tubulin suppressor-like RCC1 family protein
MRAPLLQTSPPRGCGDRRYDGADRPNQISRATRSLAIGVIALFRGWLLKIGSLAWRLAPLIVVFSCSDDITAPSRRALDPHSPLMAEAIAGISAQVNVGGFNSCTVNTVGGVRCWGRDNAGQTTVPADLPPVSQLSAGRYHTCVVTTDAMPICWGGIGENAFGQATVPGDLTSVSQVAASTLHTCALKTDRTVVCWGEDAIQTRVPLGLNSVSQISTATDHTCVLKTDQTLVCWGFNLNGQSTVPVDFPAVSQVSVGERYTCALLTGGTLRCWGNNELGQTNVPADIGSVLQISAGISHACAVKPAGIVACWGENGAGQSTVPSDLTSVLNVSAGSGHTCALRTDGTVVCWGFNGSGQIDVPPGLDLIPNEPQTITFTSVPPSPAVVGASYTVAATGGGSGNEVSFSVLATESICSVSGDVVTLLSVGSCTIAADQAGSPGYLAASHTTQTFEVDDGQQHAFT